MKDETKTTAILPDEHQGLLRFLQKKDAAGIKAFISNSFDIRDDITEPLFEYRETKDATMEKTAKITEIQDKEEHGAAAELKKILKTTRNQMFSFFKSFAEAGKAVHDGVTKKRKSELDPLDAEIDRFGKVIGDYEDKLILEQQEKEREAKIKAAKEAEKQRKANERAAAIIEKAGDAETAEELRNKKPHVQPTQYAPVKTTTKESASFRVLDWNKFFQAVINGQFPGVTISDIVSESNINRGEVNKCILKQKWSGIKNGLDITISRG